MKIIKNIGERIPFLDLKRQHLSIRNELQLAIENVMNEAAFSGGPYVEQFEKEFALYCGVKYAVAVNSGTSALHLSMLALGVKTGDEVIVPANTYIATAWGVSHAGGIPVFADCDAASWNIDPRKIEARITSKTKAIIGVHLYGQPCDITSLLSISKKYGIHFAEDAAQAHGAKYERKRVGSFGEVACFSFYPGKNLGAYGEGGAIVTNNAVLAEHLKLLRNQGSREKYYHEVIGYNERMDGIQGAVLSVKLKYLEEWNMRRQQIARRYREGITHAGVTMQEPTQNSESVYHLFVVTVNNRAAMMKYLNDNNVFPGTHYPLSIHLQNAYSQLGYKKGDFPNAEYLSEHCLSLPMFPELTNEEVDYVIDAVNDYKA